MTALRTTGGWSNAWGWCQEGRLILTREFELWQLGRLDQRQLDGSFDISMPFNTSKSGWLIRGTVSLKQGAMVGKVTSKRNGWYKPMISHDTFIDWNQLTSGLWLLPTLWAIALTGSSHGSRPLGLALYISLAHQIRQCSKGKKQTRHTYDIWYTYIYIYIPSRELTYPQKMAFWRWFSFSPGGIC